MTGLLTAVVSLLVFGAVIFVHELGHFLAARHCGIRVEEFAVGFGPTVYQTTKNGTKYTLRLLPLGGYNLFAALPEEGEGEEEEPEEDDEDDEERRFFERLQKRILADDPPPLPAPSRRKTTLFPLTVENEDYEQAPPQSRFFVTLCGALMNFVLGIAVLLVLVCTGVQGGTSVAAFFPNATSSAAGLADGDEILRVDETPVRSVEELMETFAAADPETPHTLTVLRDGKVVTLNEVTVSRGEDEDGNPVNYFDFYVKRLAKTPRNVLRTTAAYFKDYAGAILGGFAELFQGLFRGGAGMEELSGPVGVVSAVNEAVHYGWRQVLSLMALLTINLGIFNLLPIPALDGCKLLFFAFESLTGRPVSQRVQLAVNTVGMTALLCLMIFVTMQDIGRFFG